MNINKLTLRSSEFPEVLKHIPSPPKVLYRRGAPLNDLLKRPRLAIVGSRSVSTYGRQVTSQLAGQLAEQAALEAGGLAIAKANCRPASLTRS
jgi:DNA processing protein